MPRVVLDLSPHVFDQTASSHPHWLTRQAGQLCFAGDNVLINELQYLIKIRCRCCIEAISMNEGGPVVEVLGVWWDLICCQWEIPGFEETGCREQFIIMSHVATYLRVSQQETQSNQIGKHSIYFRSYRSPASKC